MAARDLLTKEYWQGALVRLSRDRPRAFAVAVGTAVVLASSIWFFTASDARGKTSRLAADAPYYHVYLPSLLLDRDLDFTNEYRITKNWYRFGRTSEKRPSNVFGIGTAVYEAPWFLIGHGVARITGSKADGFSTAEIKLTLYASLCFSLGALFFAGRVVRRRIGGRYAASVVPLLIACGGPVIYYAIRQPGYAHPFATFWVAWLVDRWDQSFDTQGPRSMRTWLAMGALLGATALARPQLALWAIIFVFAVVDDVRKALPLHPTDAGRRWLATGKMLAPRWAAGAALSVAFLIPQFLAWKAIYGSYYLIPQGDGFMRWDSPAWSETLFSSRNGLLPWAPIYGMAAVGMLVGLKRAPRLFAALLLGVLAQALANGAAWDWWAGGSFGGRRFDSCFVAFVAGLGALLIWKVPARESPRRRWIRIGGVGVGASLAVVLVIGNLIFASKMSGPTVRIYGGAPAHEIFQQRLPSPIRQVVANASAAANLPARAWFAVRHGVPLATYDRVVGVHRLGELYPGLNSFRGKTHYRINVNNLNSPFIHGLVRVPRRPGAALAAETARFFVGLNRFGPVTFTARMSAAEGTSDATVTLRLNGREIASGNAGTTPTNVMAKVHTVERGTNVLQIEAPSGTVVHWIDVRSPPDPRRK